MRDQIPGAAEAVSLREAGVKVALTTGFSPRSLGAIVLINIVIVYAIERLSGWIRSPLV